MTGSPSNPDAPALQPPDTPSANPAGATPGWREEVAARVRARRGTAGRAPVHQPSLPGLEEAFSPEAVAARVAERYARLPSWREALTAQAAAKSTVDSLVAAASTPAPPDPLPEQLSILAEPAEEEISPEQSIEPYPPERVRYSVSTDSLPAPRFAPPEAHRVEPLAVEPVEYLGDPLEDAVVEPSQPLPATLLITPRELVAPRKARPRLAEGPLSDPPTGFTAPTSQSALQPEDAQANPAVFRSSEFTDPSHATGPEPAVQPSEWHSIHLDTETPIRERRAMPSPSLDPVLHVAPLEDRAMAALVDCALTLCAFLLFSAVFALSSTVLPHGRAALIGAGAALFAMGLLYQILFFTLTDATPGMRYAKIALCTFDDENPSRPALRGRIAALLLSALPVGLGFLWAVFDEDSLGWHDRVTRTYQRSYRDE
ncbi:MAG: RDD family protein [Acidobacteriota bacterium]